MISLAEYQKLLSDSMAKDEGVEINAELVHKMHILEKQLDIAVKALEWYSDYTNSTKGVFNMKPEKEARDALKQIKELDK